MKKHVVPKEVKTGQPWRVRVEAVGTPDQRERAIRQAVRYAYSRIKGRETTPPPEN